MVLRQAPVKAVPDPPAPYSRGRSQRIGTPPPRPGGTAADRARAAAAVRSSSAVPRARALLESGEVEREGGGCAVGTPKVSVATLPLSERAGVGSCRPGATRMATA